MATVIQVVETDGRKRDVRHSWKDLPQSAVDIMISYLNHVEVVTRDTKTKEESNG